MSIRALWTALFPEPTPAQKGEALLFVRHLHQEGGFIPDGDDALLSDGASLAIRLRYAHDSGGGWGYGTWITPKGVKALSEMPWAA